MALISTHHELDDLNDGKFRHTQYMKPIGYLDGILRRIDSNWTQGNVELPHLITLAPMIVGVNDEGMRRLYPTRDLNKYLEIGTPYIKSGTKWQKVGFTGATRIGNKITWSRTQAGLSITFGGHFCKLDIELKNGYVPQDNLIAFPVGISGLTRNGLNILDGSNLVAHLKVPHVYDAVDPMVATRPIAIDFVNLSGQPYLVMTLPSLIGMTRPIIDPTLTLQPDETDGIDTYIQDTTPTTNYDGLSKLSIAYYVVGTKIHRVLIKFDLTSLPANAVISSTVLTTYIDWVSNNDPVNVSIYRQKRAWVEAQATWNIYSTGNNWSTAGGFHTDDCEQVAIGQNTWAAGAGSRTVAITGVSKSDLDLGDGWLIRADDETTSLSKDLASSSSATAANRPKLVVEYTLPVSSFKRKHRMSLLGAN